LSRASTTRRTARDDHPCGIDANPRISRSPGSPAVAASSSGILDPSSATIAALAPATPFDR
jgi:hypothetical protein